ncbi:LysM peptidoglycan-binding domain-containing protein [Anatilimnocola sp. NA78]|uniref:LysM peptidoglycan-binding domain-containing protein n=1 Tax=Anatilimnocola sp. NA78 TaxID=3415683 RepID=UPI003CE59BD2
MSTKRYLLAGLVMAGGVAAAWPFRHATPPPMQTLAVEQPPANSTWSLPQDLTLQVNPVSGSSPAPDLVPVVPVSPPPGTLTRPASFNAQPGNDPPLESLPAPPFLPMAYESLLVPVRASNPAPPTSDLSVHEPLLPSADEQAAVEREKPSPLWRRHRIVEGDTLTQLAERYLGDASRAGEIHVANIDRLASPQILPLGVTLLIPPRIQAGTASSP